jgi:chorismate synthase
VVTTVYFKPIPTLKKGLPSLSYPQLAGDFAHYERSDVCAVPAASVVAKAMVSLTMANAFIDKFACDTMTDLKQSVQTYKTYVRELTKGKVEDAS